MRAIAAIVPLTLVAASSLAPQAAVARPPVAGLGQLLSPAKPRVTTLHPHARRTPIRLADGLRDWHGRLSHLAGTVHYDSGEWIYENYPYTAYGAASPAYIAAYRSLGKAAVLAPRTPAALDLAESQAGAGPLVPDADLSQLRVAVRGGHLYVLARTTAMHAHVRTALLLLFDTGRAGTVRSVPFGSGLRTSAADTAVLVTASGARIVNLVSGRTTTAPAVAYPRGYRNALETRLPLRRVADGARVRMVAATGLVTGPRSHTLATNGEAGPLAAVAPRIAEPVQATYDRNQAFALAAHHIDQFRTTISLATLRRGTRQRLRPGPGFSMRTVTRPSALSSEKLVGDGVVQQYGLYRPAGIGSRRVPATLMLAGSSFTASMHAAIEPNLFRQLGDENKAIIVSVGSGYPAAPLSFYEGANYRLVDEVLADAEQSQRINRRRLTVAGYSMGGAGTFLFASTQPDRFAAAFAIEGVVTGVGKLPQYGDRPDLLPLLTNMRSVPIEIYQTAEDELVPAYNGVEAADTLRSLGYRYQLDIYQGDHYTPGVIDDYTYGQRMLHGARLVRHPGEVRFSRDMTLEHDIDTGFDSDEPLIGKSVGLHFDHAWFVSKLDARNRVHGVASIDVRDFARPQPKIVPTYTTGVDPGYNGEVPSPFQKQTWTRKSTSRTPHNALRATLLGTSHVRLSLAKMGLTVTRPLTARIRTNSRSRVVLRLPSRRCVIASVDSKSRHARPTHARSVRVTLHRGKHRVVVRPCGRS